MLRKLAFFPVLAMALMLQTRSVSAEIPAPPKIPTGMVLIWANVSAAELSWLYFYWNGLPGTMVITNPSFTPMNPPTFDVYGYCNGYEGIGDC